jgi:UDP-4-amino-4,6-dideoxy-N-acetyl-beta-L-altrosamine transaminase|tara:strand:- start:340 stop:1503 length:1164 start_codon:yes stop_codon:yes gene_type:complete
MIPYGKQDISDEDIASVVEVLKSDFLTQGPKVPEFEKALTNLSECNYACAVNSATSALHIACLSLDLGKGDLLWTSPVSFVASANAGLYCGANIDFVDIDLETYNLCPEKLAQKFEKAELEGRLPKILIPVHLCGQPCDMQKIKDLCDNYGVKIIEDASHAIGGSYLGKPIGNCEYSDITVFSFHPVKIITTAEGGAALTNDNDIYQKLLLLRSHGITRDVDKMTELAHGSWYYQQISLGYNYRMTDIQAALGTSQVKRIHEFITKRHQISSRYNDLLANLPVQTPVSLINTKSALHLYVIRLKLDEINASHSDIFEALRANGIGVNIHYIPIHMQPYYKSMGFKSGDYPNSEQYYNEAISLPMFPKLSEAEQDEVVDVLTSILHSK